MIMGTTHENGHDTQVEVFYVYHMVTDLLDGDEDRLTAAAI